MYSVGYSWVTTIIAVSTMYLGSYIYYAIKIEGRIFYRIYNNLMISFKLYVNFQMTSEYFS